MCQFRDCQGAHRWVEVPLAGKRHEFERLPVGGRQVGEAGGGVTCLGDGMAVGTIPPEEVGEGGKST